MSIKVNWDNKGQVFDSIEVYRATDKNADWSLLSPIATLSGTQEEYVDSDVTRGIIYHYRIKVIKGSDSFLTDVITHGYFPESGPGPQTLLRGDWECGYFGSLPYEQLISNTDLLAALGLAATPVAQSAVPEWDKFFYKGKILFMPRQHIASATYHALYTKGLVFGVDGPGKPSGYEPRGVEVNQLVFIDIGQYRYKIRSPRMTGAETEWQDLQYRVNIQNNGLATDKFNDRPPMSSQVITAHYRSPPSYIAGLSQNKSTAEANVAWDSGGNWLPVLELMY